VLLVRQEVGNLLGAHPWRVRWVKDECLPDEEQVVAWRYQGVE